AQRRFEEVGAFQRIRGDVSSTLMDGVSEPSVSRPSSGTKLRLERADDQTDVRPRLALRPSVEDRSGLNRDRAWAHGGHPTLNLVPITDRRRAR
ncbi:unnamed protein product, partial [Lampetra fluviatilis]